MPICRGTKKDGSRCTRELEGKQRFCWQHVKRMNTGRSKSRSKSRGRSKGYSNTTNNTNNNSRNLTRLSKVKTFTYFASPLIGKRILLLGEAHTMTGFCSEPNKNRGEYNVEDWLYELSKEAPECLDIIIEVGPGKLEEQILPSESHLKGTSIDRINNKFEDCFPFKSSRCESRRDGAFKSHKVTLDGAGLFKSSFGTPFGEELFKSHKVTPSGQSSNREQCFSQNIRYHYGDIRQYYSGLKANNIDIKFNKNFWDKRRRILGYILGLTDDDSVYKSYMRYVESDLNLPYDEENDRVFMRMFRKKRDIQLNKLSIDKERFLETLLEVYMSLTSEETKLPLLILSSLMDVYTLSRMFIQFDQNKMGRSPLGCRNNREMKNIIFYGGYAHSFIYKKFIETYFGVKPQISKGEYRLKKDPNDSLKQFRYHCVTLDEPFDFFS